MKALLLRKILRWLLVLSVGSWMGGAGCVLSCTSQSYGASPIERITYRDVAASVSHAGMMQSHHCCHKPGSTKSPATPAITGESRAQLLFSTSTGPLGECPLVQYSGAVVNKTQSDDSIQPAVHHTGDKNLVSITARSLPARASTYLPNRGPTYLRCCVFLI